MAFLGGIVGLKLPPDGGYRSGFNGHDDGELPRHSRDAMNRQCLRLSPIPQPGWALIGKQSRQPRLRLAPLLCLGVESRSQVTDNVVLLGQALAQHLHFDL